MPILSDELDWSSSNASRFRVPIVWRTLPKGGCVASVRGENWQLQLGDFPSEPMWTLLVNGRVVARFSEWPPEWKREERPDDGGGARKKARRFSSVLALALVVAVAAAVWGAATAAANAGLLDLQSPAPIAGACLVLAVVVLAVLRSRSGRKFKKKTVSVSAVEPDRSTLTEYVIIEDDGSARELEPFEIDYLNTEFHGADGARPYIKASYPALTPDGRIGGFLPREKLPAGVRVKSASEGTAPVRTTEEAIAIAKTAISNYAPHASIDVDKLGAFSAELADGIWRVTRVPEPAEAPTPPPIVGPLPRVVRLSAASGRITSYGWG